MVPTEGIGILCYPTIGGSGRVATGLANRLVRRGLPVHLLSYEKPGGLDPGVAFHWVQVLEYPLLKYPPYDQALAAAIVGLHRREGLTLFHAHYALPHALAVLLADQMLGGGRIRLVTTLHGTDITLVGGDPSYREPLLFGLEGSGLVTAVSRSLRDDTRRILGFRGEVSVIPNFVDAEEFRPGSRPRWIDRPGSEPREVVHVSTFRPVKRVDLLVQAALELARRLPVRLTLVGEGPELPEARARAEEAGLDLRCLGAVEDPSPHLVDADLFLFSSRMESFGLGVLEAMACGVPVVGPSVGGVPEVLGDPPAGILLPDPDPADLAGAAQRVLTEPGLYRELSRRGRSRAETAYRPEDVVAAYLAAYDRLS